MIRTMTLSLCVAALGACAADPATQPGTDPLAGETGDGEAAKADSAHDTFGFIAVEKSGAFNCNNPLTCTHYTLTRPNRSTIKCNDSSYHDSCAIGALDWTAAGLSQEMADKMESALEAQAMDPSMGVQVLVRGQFKIYVDFLAFAPSEVWLAQLTSTEDTGVYVQLFDSNIRCVTTPCPTYEEDKLNSTRTSNTEGLDYGSSVSSKLQGTIETAIQDKGAIVRGGREYSGRESLRSVDQVYLPVH